MKLLLDQGLPRSAAPLLRAEGIDVIHVGEIEMSAAEDIEIINKARVDDRVVVTLDSDFHALLALDQATTPSVIRIRMESLQAKAFTELLLRVISECIDELQQGVAVTVEPGRIRIRHLPLN